MTTTWRENDTTPSTDDQLPPSFRAQMSMLVKTQMELLREVEEIHQKVRTLLKLLLTK